MMNAKEVNVNECIHGWRTPIIIYTGQKKVALLDVETHDNPIPLLESYTMTQGKVWAVICQPGKFFIIINLKECDN